MTAAPPDDPTHDPVARGNQFARAVRAPAGPRGIVATLAVGLLRMGTALLLLTAVLLPPALVGGMLWNGVRARNVGTLSAGLVVGAIYVMALRGVLRRAWAERRAAQKPPA